MASEFSVDKILDSLQQHMIIEEQPQTKQDLTFYSTQPTSTSLGEQICNTCEKCAMVPLKCVCGPVDWCSRNCCENGCDKAWAKGCCALGCVAAITLLVIFHPCS